MTTVPIRHFEVKDPEKSDKIDGTSKAAHSLDFEQQDNYLSLSVDNISVNLLDQRKSTNDESAIISLIGATMMIITTLMFSISHIASKVFYTRCPEASGFDMVSAQGYSLVPFYFIYAKLKGVNLNLFNFEPKVQMLIILRVFIGITNNIALYAGLKYISIGKGILIFSLSPLFCTITAGVFLKEQISLFNSALTLASFGGVYLLTLNKPQNEVDASMETFGYILTLTAALLFGVLFVVLRALNTYKISLLVSPFYSGVGTLSQTIFILIVKPDLIHSELYDSVNLSLLI